MTEELREQQEQPRRADRSHERGALSGAVAGFRRNSLSAWAAALTYYGILSIFPALVAVVSALGLLGSDAIDELLDEITSLVPGTGQEILTTTVESLQGSRGAAITTFVIGLAIAIWSASAYVGAFMRAANVVYDMPEGRPFWKTIPIRIAVTIVLLIVLVVTAVVVVATGDLAARAGEAVGLGETVVTVWDIAKWPVLVVIVAVVFSILYWATPNVRQRGFRWVSAGSGLAVVLWVIASAAFAVYLANFGNYHQTYGALAGVIIFLVWLWISNMAILFGLELDAQLLRRRADRAGVPHEDEPYLQPRDTRKFDQP